MISTQIYISERDRLVPRVGRQPRLLVSCVDLRTHFSSRAHGTWCQREPGFFAKRVAYSTRCHKQI